MKTTCKSCPVESNDYTICNACATQRALDVYAYAAGRVSVRPSVGTDTLDALELLQLPWPAGYRNKKDGYYVKPEYFSKCRHPGLAFYGACAVCRNVRKLEAAGPDKRGTHESAMMRAQPELVIDKRSAKNVGLTVYRTGRECVNGHRGFRYVSTGGCIDCLRGR